VSSPETGAIVWNTTTSTVNQYNGSAWKEMLRSDGSAAALTAIPAGNLTGTVADARISALTASKLTGALPAISGANLTGVGVAGITSSADATAITINSSEQVGIGTGSPTGNAKLHIYNGASGQAEASNNTELTIENSGTTGIQFLTPNTAVSGLWFGDPENKEVGRMYYVHSENSLKFFTDASERLRIDSDGIKFNADTAAANALDDYEEGTWSPTFDGNTMTNYGTYRKIGKMVYVVVTISEQASSATFSTITGLPFSGGGFLRHGRTMGSDIDMNDHTYMVSGTSIVIYRNSDSGGVSMTIPSSTTRVDISGTYMVS
jgi:hypothetical protein